MIKSPRKKSEELGDGLSFVNVLKRSFSSLFGTESGLKDWLNQQSKDFELQLNTQLRDKLHAGHYRCGRQYPANG
jgi:hypothetical protein